MGCIATVPVTAVHYEIRGRQKQFNCVRFLNRSKIPKKETLRHTQERRGLEATRNTPAGRSTDCALAQRTRQWYEYAGNNNLLEFGRYRGVCRSKSDRSMRACVCY